MNKLIIFDLDNTFYSYEPTHEKALDSVYKSQTIFKSYDLFIENYNIAKEKIHHRLFSNPSRHSKLLYFKEMFNEILSHNEILILENLYWETFITIADIKIEGVNSLKNLKNINDKYILCTNQNTNVQLKKIHSWNLDMFDRVITSEEVGYEKPAIEFFNYVENFFEDIEINEYKIYAIGDSYENDIQYWQEGYNASSYLIENDLEEFISNNKLFNTNFDKAIKHLFS